MESFSEYLDMLISDSGLTEQQLSQLSGISRSYIALMRSGRNLCSDEKKMTKLMDALNLSPCELDLFREKYFRAKIGSKSFEQDLSIFEFINSFSKIPNNIAIYPHITYPEITCTSQQTLFGNSNVMQCIQMLIEKEAEKKDGFVHIMMNDDKNFLGDLISKAYAHNKNLKIDHIVCLDNNTSAKNKSTYNINLTTNLVTTVVRSNSYNYQVYYYYSNLSSTFSTANLLCYMILTSEGMICMDSELNCATLFADNNIQRLYDALFQKHLSICKKLFLDCTSVPEYVSAQTKYEYKENKFFTLSQQPCVAIINCGYLIDKYFYNSTCMEAQIYKQRLHQTQENFLKLKYKCISFCTKAGIARLMNDGRINEVPFSLYQPLSMSDRRKMLRLYLQAIKDNYLDVYFVDEIFPNLPDGLHVNIIDLSNTVFSYHSPKDDMMFVINEPGIVHALSNTIKHLPKYLSENAKDEAKKYLENLLL